MELSLDAMRDAIRSAICEKYPLQSLWIRDVYLTHVILSDYSSYESHDFWKVSYTIDSEGVATLADDLQKVKMIVEYLPVAESVQIQEAIADGDGWKWRVVLIAPGLSHNKFMYSETVLRTATPLFEGVRALARTDDEHLSGKGASVEKICGWFEEVEYVEGTGVVGTFTITQDCEWLKLKLQSAFDAGKTDLIGFSIVAAGSGRRELLEGQLQTTVDSIDSVQFCDCVVSPSAGGRVLQLVASVSAQQIKEMDMLKTLLAMLEAQRPDLYARVDLTNVTEEQVTALLAEAVAPLPSPVIPPVTPPAQTVPAVIVPPVITPPMTEAVSSQVPPTTVVVNTPAQPAIDQATVATLTQLLEATRQSQATLQAMSEAAERRIQMSEARAILSDTLRLSTLPAAAVARVQARFKALLDAGTMFTQTQLTEALTAERDYLASLHSSGAITGFGPETAGRLQIGESTEDKAVKMLDDFFQGKSHSFRECYIAVTGDTRVTGYLREAKGLANFTGILRESVNTGVFDQVFADALNRQLVREYTRLNLNLWRVLCDIVPANDFRTRHRIRIGGYANLGPVAQGAPYPALVSPTDEEATYAVSKRGGTEDLTLEAIRNDDVSAIRLIPLRMARAAAQTLHEFVFDFLATNPTIYDGIALFHASHANLNTVAFSAAEYMVHRRKMRSQTEMDSLKALGILPKVLLVPNTLEEAGYNAFRQDTNLAPRLVQTEQIRPQIIVVDYWTDTNNWYSAASVDQTPMIELAFLDGNEDPEMFVQDMPEVGSMFTNDKRTYKIRHIYGGTIVDYRGFQGGIVA